MDTGEVGRTDVGARLAVLCGRLRSDGRVPTARGSSVAMPAPSDDDAITDPGDPTGSPDVGEACVDSEVHDREAIQTRALASAALAYSVAHGHPPEATPFVDGGGRRWATRGRVAAVAAAALVVVGGVVVVRTVQQTPSVVIPVDSRGTPGVELATGTSDPEASPGPEVVVHVVGAVLQPGLVHLQQGARLADAIDAAGGASPDADLSAINLARILTDGEQIVVPRPGEQVEVADGPAGGVIDLNTADVDALDELPGIGPVLAERIVQWRTEHGGFTVVDELTEVSGIGPSLLDGLRDLVRVG